MLWAENVEAPFEQQEVQVDDVSYVLPFLRMMSGDEEIILHPFNSTVRRYVDDANDHLELKRDGYVQGIHFHEDMLDLFEDYNFDVHWSKLPDKATIDWLANVAMSHIDEEIDEVLEDDE